MTEFHFNGRYTLRGINGTYCLYDRELDCVIHNKDFKEQTTLTKAKEELIKFKSLHNDKI